MNCPHCGYSQSPTLPSCVSCRKPIEGTVASSASFGGNPSLLPWIVGVALLIGGLGFGGKMAYDWHQQRQQAKEQASWEGRSNYGGNLEIHRLRLVAKHGVVKLHGQARNVGPRDVADAEITITIGSDVRTKRLGPIGAGDIKEYNEVIMPMDGLVKFTTIRLNWVELE